MVVALHQPLHVVALDEGRDLPLRVGDIKLATEGVQLEDLDRRLLAVEEALRDDDELRAAHSQGRGVR
jgi:hypothetical protein